MNKTWHLHNKLPQGASDEKRMNWHIAHQKNCGCRPIPKSLLDKITQNPSPGEK